MYWRHCAKMVASAFSRPHVRRKGRPRRARLGLMVEPLESRSLLSGGVVSTITASAQEITHGQSVSFTASVTGASGSGGIVAFFDEGILLDTETPSVINGVNQATYTTSALTLGQHNIFAIYGQSPQDATAAWPGTTFTSVLVDPASVTLTLQIFAPEPATGSGDLSPKLPVAAPQGQAILITAKVTSPDGIPPEYCHVF